MHQIVAVVLRYLKRLGPNRLVQRFEQFARQIATVVDSAIHRDELLERRLILDGRIVQRRVQHDDREAQHIAGVRVGEDVRIQLAVALREALHHAIDLLRFAGQPERPQELAQRLHQDQIGEIVQFDESLQHLLVEVVLLAEIIACERRANRKAIKCV